MGKRVHSKAYLRGYPLLADHAMAFSSKQSMHWVTERYEGGWCYRYHVSAQVFEIYARTNLSLGFCR